MIYPKPKNEEESKKYHRQAYELEKEGLVSVYREMNYDKKNLNRFLVNSLKKDFPEELREDGLM